MKRRVLLLVGRKPKDKENSLNYGVFLDRLQQEFDEKVELEIAALKEFRFEIGTADTKVWIPSRGIDVRDFDLVMFRLWSNEPERTAALVHYLQYYGIAYSDPSAGLGRGSKAASAMARWSAGMPLPATVFGTPALLRQYMKQPDESLAYPCILKSVTGRKGQDNYLVNSDKELQDIFKREKKEATDIEFILQEFIPSDGDYRFLVFGRYIRCVIHRRGQKDSHLSNTSQGGTAELVQSSDFPQKLRHDVLRVTSMEGVEVAGVDIIIHRETGQHYVLEVNRSPQLLTGAFPDEKIAAYARYLKNRSRQAVRPKLIIGRRANVILPEFGNLSINSKVDTGAYRSSLHAEDIKVNEESGVPTLHFSVKDANGTMVRKSTTDFKSTQVRPSGGTWQRRYVIRTVLVIAGKKHKTMLTLTDRGSMRHPLLLGRRLLRHRFVVDVALTEGFQELRGSIADD